MFAMVLLHVAIFVHTNKDFFREQHILLLLINLYLTFGNYSHCVTYLYIHIRLHQNSKFGNFFVLTLFRNQSVKVILFPYLKIQTLLFYKGKDCWIFGLWLS